MVCILYRSHGCMQCIGSYLFLFLNHQDFSFQERMMICIPSQQKYSHHVFFGLLTSEGTWSRSFKRGSLPDVRLHSNMLYLDSIVVW